MLKVAIFSHEIPSTTFVENLIKGLAENNIEIYLYGFKRKDIDYKNKNIKIIYFKNKPFSRVIHAFVSSFKLLIKDPKKLKKLYATCFDVRDLSNSFYKISNYAPILLNSIDIFHYQWGADILHFKELYTILDSKIILSFRGAHINYAPLFRKDLRDSYKEFFPKTNAFHAVSNAIAIESIQYGADKNKITTIYTSIDPLFLAENKFEFEKPKAKNTINIVSVGRFHWKKGYNYALDSIALLVNKNIQIKYTIIAQGNDIEELLFQIHQLKLNNYVEIIKGLPHNEVVQKIKNADIFLLPSIEEGIANVVIEAMSLGTFVVTTDCGGMAEVIVNEMNGIIVPIRDIHAIEKAILRYIELDENSINHMRKNARELVEQKFTRDRMIKEFISFYEKTMSE
jgi:colanic acid/amylovoran biosynthesis glycosyltransferase